MLRIDPDFLHYGGWAERLAGLICGIADLGHPSCDVNKPYDLRVVSGLGDDGAAPGVAHENDRAVLHGDDSTRRIRVVRQRRERILNGDDVKSALFKDWDDLGPTGAVCEGPVNENDILHGSLLRSSIRGAGEGGGGCNGSCKNNFSNFHFLSSLSINCYRTIADVSCGIGR